MGKSSLVLRLMTNDFQDHIPSTIGGRAAARRPAHLPRGPPAGRAGRCGAVRSRLVRTRAAAYSRKNIRATRSVIQFEIWDTAVRGTDCGRAELLLRWAWAARVLWSSYCLHVATLRALTSIFFWVGQGQERWVRAAPRPRCSATRGLTPPRVPRVRVCRARRRSQLPVACAYVLPWRGRRTGGLRCHERRIVRLAVFVADGVGRGNRVPMCVGDVVGGRRYKRAKGWVDELKACECSRARARAAVHMQQLLTRVPQPPDHSRW